MIRLKHNVRARGIAPEALLIVQIAAPIWLDEGADECVVTSITDGDHSTGSKHHTGEAIDLRTKNLPDQTAIRSAAERLQTALGDSYDVVTESTHCHVEYDES